LITNILSQLKRDEGLSLKPYRDSRGIITVGYGHNLEVNRESAREITEERANQFLQSDLEEVTRRIHMKIDWADRLDTVRFGVLQNLGFNVGVGALLGFKKTLGYIENGDYNSAADEMLDSDWAKQVGDRAVRLAEQMRSGQWV